MRRKNIKCNLNKTYMNDNKNGFSISLLPNDVVIMNITKNSRYKLLQPILELSLLRKEKNHFYSITSTNNELSIITDKSVFDKVIKDGNMELYYDYISMTKIYKIMQFYEGVSGISHTGIVEKISKMFNKVNVPIIYINTYNNNFILIDKNDLEKCKHIIETSQ